ncbi:MAG: alpha-N-acetylglucosaminidase TIM-barrel domain-containing protein [Actinomycetota bacterium]
MRTTKSSWFTRTRFLGAAAVVLALAGGMLGPVASAQADEAVDLARWDFTGGAASDVSWHGHDGVAGSGVSFTGAGAVFNGSDAGEITVEYATSYQPEAADADDTWRIEVDGVSPTVVSGNHRAIVGSRAADDGWVLYITPQGRIEFWVASTGGSTKYAIASSGVTATAGSTYDIVAERTGNAISIAVRGSATGTGSGTLAGSYIPVADGGPLRFGNGGNTGTDFHYSGSIAGATIGIEEGEDDGEPPVDPEPPVTIPDPTYPLDDETYEAAARGVLERSIGDAADQVDLDFVRDEDADESYTISGTDGAISIEATSPSALTAGAGWYLKYVVRAAVNLGNPTPVVPDVLPAPESPITNTGHEGYRFAMNDTNEGYTDPYLDWEGWQRLLDNLALHGVNQVFLSIGTDAIFAELLQEYGYSDAEARAWIPQPAHQPWWVLQNISSENQEPMTQAMLDERADLASRIVDRADELGITPVLPGYFGTVPTDFADRNPDAKVVPQGTWSNYQRPGWLDPTGEVFADVAADFYRLSSELIGDAGAYKMDPLHEGGRPGDVSVPGAAGGIEDALRAAHPDALWALLGWQSNPTMTLLSGVKDHSKLLIVDGLSDTVNTLDRESRWPGIPYAFGSIYNFGGNTSMGAISTVWLDRYFTARDKAGSALTGVAILPEGFYNNPAAYELMSELPWMDDRPDHTQWFRDYAEGRYGSEAGGDAWEIIAETAYSMEPIGTHSESHDSLFAAQPSLTATKARACCARGEIRYDLAEFATALPALIDADSSVVQRAAYEYDLTDVTRQVIANLSHELLPQINAAYGARDLETFDELTGTWLDMIAQLDAVIATNSEFLLGAYVDRAEAQNGAIGAYDLQNLLTTWGTKASFSLHDYANREWQGLVGDFYASRWEQYFDTLRTTLTQGGNPASIDWYEVDEAWAKGNHDYPAEPSGDIVEEAEQTVDALAQGTASLSLTASEIRPGTSGTVTAEIQNTSPLGMIDEIEVTLDTPDGITATPTSETTVEDLAPGERLTMTWDVSAGDAVASATAELVATASVLSGDDESESSASVRVLVGEEPSEPWETFTTESTAGFAVADEQIAIRSTGADMSRGTRKYSTVYQDEAMVDGDTITVHVDLQESERSRPWARSGIVIGNDLTNATSPLVLLALTPSNGCTLTWNGASSGSLDTHRYAADFSDTVWLRLTRTGNGFEGSCSDDGETWTVLGTAAPNGIADTTDAGLLASAVNSGGSDRVVTAFSEWTVGDDTYDIDVRTEGAGEASAALESARAGALIALSATPEDGHRLGAWESSPDAITTHNTAWTLAIDGITPGELTGTHQAIASSRGTENRGWVVYIAPGGELQFYLWPEGASNWVTYRTGVVVTPGDTYDLDATIEDGTLRLEVAGDGEAAEEFDVDTPVLNSGTSPLRIGNGGDNGDEYFYRGSLDALTIADDDTLLAEWEFDGSAEDTSGNGHDGTSGDEVTFADGRAVFVGSDDSEIVVDYDLALEPGSWLRMPDSDVTVTAVFEGVPYSVAYDANGGTGSTADTDHVFGTESALALNGFVRDGFTFAGWASSADGDVEFSDGSTVSELSAVEDDVVTLYAVWKEQPAEETPTITLGEDTVRAGGDLDLSGSGFEPGEEVRVILYSTPVQLAEFTADETGSISGTVTIPVNVSAGAHEIELRGSDSALSVRADLTVLAAVDDGDGSDGGNGSDGGGAGGDGSDPSDGLATTGAALSILLPLLGLLLLGVGARIMIRRRGSLSEG